MTQRLHPVPFPNGKPKVWVRDLSSELSIGPWEIEKKRQKEQCRAPFGQFPLKLSNLGYIRRFEPTAHHRDGQSDCEQEVGHDGIGIAAIVVGMPKEARRARVAPQKINHNHAGDSIAAKPIQREIARWRSRLVFNGGRRWQRYPPPNHPVTLPAYIVDRWERFERSRLGRWAISLLADQ